MSLEGPNVPVEKPQRTQRLGGGSSNPEDIIDWFENPDVSPILLSTHDDDGSHCGKKQFTT